MGGNDTGGREVVDGSKSPVTAAPKEPRRKRNPAILWWTLAIILVLIGVVALLFAPEPNEGFATGAAALAFISATAVGIERSIEAFWTFVGRMKNYGGWWPLNDVTDAIIDYENAVNDVLAIHLVTAGAVLQQAMEAATAAGNAADCLTEIADELDKLQPHLTLLQTEVANAEKLAPDSPRFVLLTGTVTEAIDTLNSAAEVAANFGGTASAILKRTADESAAVLDQATDIVSAFTDNPSRKLMSLLLGAIASVAIAGLMGLNLFSAVLTDTSSVDVASSVVAEPSSVDESGCDGAAGCLDNRWGILLTGIIIGLGANPTHEVIRAL